MSTEISWCHWFHEPSGKWIKGGTLNPIVGCSHAGYTSSDGQKHAHPGCGGYGPGEPRCYAERFCSRGMSTDGVHAEASQGGRWTGKVIFRPEYLARPFTHPDFRPRRDGLKRFVFLTSLSDMGHPSLDIEAWKAINGMMLLSPWNIYMDLTKRPEVQRQRIMAWYPADCVDAFCRLHLDISPVAGGRDWLRNGGSSHWSAASHIRRYVSVSDQETADALIPELLRIPASFRGVSYEPAVGPVIFVGPCPYGRAERYDYLTGIGRYPNGDPANKGARVDHVIVGGQSGSGASPFDLGWARATIERCRLSGTALYMKQCGARPWLTCSSGCSLHPGEWCGHTRPILERIKGRSGANPAEWPEDLRVQKQVMP